MIPLQHVFLGAAVLFVTGVAIVLVRRELLYMLMGIEVMFNAAALVVLGAGQHWRQADGQIFVVVVMAVTAAELVVVLVLVWLAWRHYHAHDARVFAALAEAPADSGGKQMPQAGEQP